MTIEDLKKQISEIVESKGISEQEVISGIIAHLGVKYQPKNYSAEDRIILDKLKDKILIRLYREPRHKKTINRATKFDELFSIDEIEMKLLQDAFIELEAEGYVYALEYEIGLKEDGIRKAR